MKGACRGHITKPVLLHGHAPICYCFCFFPPLLVAFTKADSLCRRSFVIFSVVEYPPSFRAWLALIESPTEDARSGRSSFSRFARFWLFERVFEEPGDFSSGEPESPLFAFIVNSRSGFVVDASFDLAGPGACAIGSRFVTVGAGSAEVE